MEVIRFEDVTKTFVLQESHAFKDYLLGIAGKRPKTRTIRAVDGLTFSVNSGESVALLGHNGSGKSTSLKLLSGVLQPSAGIIRAKGRLAPLLELLHKRVRGKCHPNFERLLPWRSQYFAEPRVFGHNKQLYGHNCEATDHRVLYFLVQFAT